MRIVNNRKFYAIYKNKVSIIIWSGTVVSTLKKWNPFKHKRFSVLSEQLDGEYLDKIKVFLSGYE